MSISKERFCSRSPSCQHIGDTNTGGDVSNQQKVRRKSIQSQCTWRDYDNEPRLSWISFGIALASDQSAEYIESPTLADDCQQAGTSKYSAKKTPWLDFGSLDNCHTMTVCFSRILGRQADLVAHYFAASDDMLVALRRFCLAINAVYNQCSI